MPSKTSKKKLAATLPHIPKEVIDQFVSGPMTAEAVNAASMAFKKALIGRALGGERILNTSAMEREYAQALAEEHRGEILRMANEYGIETKDGVRNRSLEDIEAELIKVIPFEIGKAGESWAGIRNAALAEGITTELEAVETPIADSYYGDKRRDASVLMYQDLANAIQEKIDDRVRLEESAGEWTDAVAAVPETGRTRETGQDRPALELAGETEAELAARDKAAKDAEAQRLKDEQAADNKRQADAERDTFSLTGSDRPADVMAAQGQGGLFNPVPTKGGDSIADKPVPLGHADLLRQVRY